MFIGVTVPEYNIDVTQLEAAYSARTITHSLDNPFNLEAIRSFYDKYNPWLVEDNCDTLGSTCIINGGEKKTGTVGDIGTSSFYPPHHMTMGKGGAIYVDSPQLHKIVNSFRDWRHDCWCIGDVDNTYGCRFTKQFGEFPFGLRS